MERSVLVVTRVCWFTRLAEAANCSEDCAATPKAEALCCIPRLRSCVDLDACCDESSTLLTAVPYDPYDLATSFTERRLCCISVRRARTAAPNVPAARAASREAWTNWLTSAVIRALASKPAAILTYFPLLFFLNRSLRLGKSPSKTVYGTTYLDSPGVATRSFFFSWAFRSFSSSAHP